MSAGKASRNTKTFAAIDLGASTGRVIQAVVGPDRLDTAEVHRFANEPRSLRDALRWDFSALERGAREGLRRVGPVDGIGIDSWAVDYGLLDSDGRLIDDPVHYRDRRTQGVPEQIFQHVSAQRLYQLTGIQNQPFNTVHQLYAERLSARFKAAARILMIPDLLCWKLTGVAGTEVTNASTTGLLNPATRAWEAEIANALGIGLDKFPSLREPGEPAGFSADFQAPVFAVASHDTASAVAAIPATVSDFGYISCGTWSLVGVELRQPVLTEQSRAANFTNELGIDGTVRYLRNVTGLWLLQECLRAWGVSEAQLPALLAAAGAAPARRSLIDATDPAFVPPGRMPERIARACRAAGQPEPRTEVHTVRCILDSLADAYRRALDDATRLSGRRVDVVHLVGGGARNRLLCQLTADATGLPVVAGPVEAAALGNTLIQARAAGAVHGKLDDLRALVAATQRLHRYEPMDR